jgi:UDP-N-acetylmuramoyl-tripeptide--D-alanyl-D-alanine ligase
MICMRLSELAAILQAPLVGADRVIDSISTDSRTLEGAAVFLALKGANFDGNQFLAEVAAKGAVALICNQVPSLDIPYILVPDGRQALGQLGAALKQRLAPKTVAITGSAGKTTVKEMLAAILQQQGPVLATAGNFNNDIGVPLTLLRLTEQHRFAVLELGANHPGEIAYTTALVKPDVALITNAAASHLEGFGDIYGVARAKAEIYHGLTARGVAIVSLDSDYSDYWLAQVTTHSYRTFSTQNPAADFYASAIQLDELGCAHFVLHHAGAAQQMQLRLPGRHNVANALAAAAAALELGLSLQQVQQGLLQMQPVKGRTNIKQLKPGLRLIDDTYNANVESVKAAIDLLASYSGFRGLLLGDMGELGANARLYHEQIGDYAKKAGINLLFTLGVLSQSASDRFGSGGAHFSQRQTLLKQLMPLLAGKSDATLLVKGSRSARMELVVQDLLERSQQETSPC